MTSFYVSVESPKTRTFASAFMYSLVTTARRKQLPNPNKIKLCDIVKVKTDLPLKLFL